MSPKWSECTGKEVITMVEILKLQSTTAKNEGEDGGWSTWSVQNCTNAHEM
ncbi:hypothetical protein [Nocardia fluminea]|uniref:hypothetical protein n=1 Tax=Nocardia fluminea TaxID=134984 RepID=UPI0037966090